MGGAERGERKRRQQAAAAQAGGSGGSSGGSGGSAGSGGAAGRTRRVAVAAAGVAVLIALVVGIGVWLQARNAPDSLPAAVPLAPEGPRYPVAVQDDAVVTGSQDARVTIDVYEDFMCPACARFENTYGEQLDQAAAAGRARVVYHPIAILDALSEPPGYSSLAAGGAFCAAETGVFPRYHDSLFAHQPSEGGAGWTQAQLERLARDLGAGDEFGRCLAGAGPRATAATDRASQYLSTLRPDGRVGTPTVVVNGVAADVGDESWLDDALARGGR